MVIHLYGESGTFIRVTISNFNENIMNKFYEHKNICICIPFISYGYVKYKFYKHKIIIRNLVKLKFNNNLGKKSVDYTIYKKIQ